MRDKAPSKPGIAARITIRLVRIYQSRTVLRGLCKFHPTCSQYTIEALQKYGLLRGLCLAVIRLARCHPLTLGGVDLVP